MTATLNSVPWRCLFFVIIVTLGTVAPARSEDKVAEERWNVIADCQMVVLPQKLALPLIPDLSDDDKIEAAWARVQQMIERGEATLIANLSVRGDSGTRMVAESIQEMRYGTEFYPWDMPEAIPKDHAAEAPKNWPLVGIRPTAFETRNVGATLELEPTVSNDGQWISLEAVPQHVRFLHFAKIEAGILPSGKHLSVEQPYFSTLKDTLTMHIRAGQRVLIGIHKVPTEENTMELFVLRVRTQRTGNAQ